jgi:hypothetical protein
MLLVKYFWPQCQKIVVSYFQKKFQRFQILLFYDTSEMTIQKLVFKVIRKNNIRFFETDASVRKQLQ